MCRLMCGAGPGDLWGGPRGRIRPHIPGKPGRESQARPPSGTQPFRPGARRGQLDGCLKAVWPGCSRPGFQWSFGRALAGDSVRPPGPAPNFKFNLVTCDKYSQTAFIYPPSLIAVWRDFWVPREGFRIGPWVFVCKFMWGAGPATSGVLRGRIRPKISEKTGR